MFKLIAAGLLCACLAVAQSPKYGVGSAAGESQIKTMNITILPDGTGLPPGSGTVAQGQDVYSRRCARCHGQNLEGAEQGAALIGGAGSLTSEKPKKTVISYWPYATTIYDYVNRAMPFNQPGLLTADQVYAVTAFILHKGGVIQEGEVMNAQTLPKVQMPNRDGFIPDDRPDVGPKKTSKK